MSCPDCPPARAARALVFDEAFWRTALVVMLPYAVIALALWLLVRNLDRGGAHD